MNSHVPSLSLNQRIHLASSTQFFYWMAVLDRLSCRAASSIRTFCAKSIHAELRRVSSALSSAIPAQNPQGKGRNVQWVFLGCPGVGKGTYASRLSRPHIATGDLVRDELSSHRTLASELAEIVNHGKLISDEIIIDLLSKQLKDSQTKGDTGFILDDFPWTVRQAEILAGVTDIDLVINLRLREEALIAKCLGRRICSECGKNYNLACVDIKGEDGHTIMYMPPLPPPPQCESKLITRLDDIEEVIKERIRVYNEIVLHFLETSSSRPVEEFYHNRGKLLEFDVPGGIPESWPKLLRALNLDDHENKRTAAA